MDDKKDLWRQIISKVSEPFLSYELVIFHNPKKK